MERVLAMYIVGGIDDQILFLVWERISSAPFEISIPNISNNQFYQAMFEPFIRPWLNHQPIFTLFASLFLSLFGAGSYNVFLLLTLVGNFIGAYLLFRRFRFWWVYSLIFTFSSYTWVHFGIHPVLSQIWIYPVFIYLLTKMSDGPVLRGSVILGLFLAVGILVSNYIGFFLLLAFPVFLFFRVLIYGNFLREMKTLLTATLVCLIVILFFLIPYLRSTYAPESYGTKVRGNEVAIRPYEDFFYFSSRPWYPLIPSTKHLYLGGFSKLVLKKIESTKYFLADDYFVGEHSADFYGLMFIFTVFTICAYVFVKGDIQTKKSVFLFLGVSFVLFILMFPPFFTISGVEVWMPSYAVSKLFPMFRVTARLGVLILLFLLLALAHGIEFMYARGEKSLLRLFVVLLLLVTLFETFSPVRIRKIGNAPAIYEYLRNNTPLNAKVAVYPQAKAEEALFWLPVHQRELLNL